MNLDRDFLFGCLTVQAGKLSAIQIAEARAAIEHVANVSLADWLVAEKLLTPQDRSELNEQVQTHLKPHSDGGLPETGEYPRPNSASTSALPQGDPSTNQFVETIDTVVSVNSPDAALRPSIDGSDNPSSATIVLDDTRDFERGGAPLNAQQLAVQDTISHEPGVRSRYTLTRVHGQGGLGQVWLATDPTLNRQIALKNILPEKDSNPQARRRLIREAQITGQLEHPNIIPIYELEQSDENGTPYYTMRFLGGHTLEDEIRKYHARRAKGEVDPLDLPRLLNCFIDICNAMAYAGSRGIIHRDLKPQNVMLGDFGEVIVLDWGLAKQVGQKDEDLDPVISDDADMEKTRQGQIVGSPAYMAPEQARGQHDHADQRTDVYGLGAILFTILVGRAPHQGEKTGKTARNTMDMLKRISSGETPRLREADPTLPVPLEAICARAMARKRSERYQDAAELARDVQRWLADEPVSAYVEPWQQRLGRWLRRHRAWTQSVAAALVLVAIVSAVAALFVEQARRSEHAAHEKTQAALTAEQEALAATRAAKEEATRRFRQARRAVDQSFTGISDGLLNYPGVQELRTQLLRDAAQHYQQFTEERSNDPELRIEFALALTRLGDVHRLLAAFDESKRAYEQARSIFHELVLHDATNVEAQFVLAQAHNKLGLLHVTVGTMPDTADSVNSYQLAEEAYMTAGEGCGLLLKADPKNAEYRRLAAQILANRGVLFSRSSRYEEATDVLAQAGEEFDRLAAETDALSDREELAKSRISLGELLILTGRGDEAEKELIRAIREYERLVESDADQPQYLQGLADARLTLANAVHALGRPSEPAALYQAAIDDYVALIRSRPDVPAYRERLATAQIDLAQVLSRIGRNADAQEHAELGFSLVMELVNSNPNVVEYFVKEVYAVVTLGQVLRDLDNLTLAETAYGKGIEKTGALIELFPDESLYQRLRGQSFNGLGITYLLSGANESARQTFMSARTEFQNAIELAPNDEFSHDGLAWANMYLGDTLRLLQREDEATEFYRQSLKTREAWQLNAEHRYRLGWLLVHCQDPAIRDESRGLDIASKLSLEYPTRADYLELQAVAWYRQEKWAQCLSDLDRAEIVRISVKSPLDFLRAMALWQQNEPVPAKAALDRAIARMEKNAPGDWKLRTLRQEAEALLASGAATDEPAAP